MYHAALELGVSDGERLGFSVGSQGSGGGGGEGPMELSGDVTPFFSDSFFLGGWIFTPSDMGTASSPRSPPPPLACGLGREGPRAHLPLAAARAQDVVSAAPHRIIPRAIPYHEGYGTALHEHPLPCTYTNVALPTKRSAFSTLWVKKTDQGDFLPHPSFPNSEFPLMQFHLNGKDKTLPPLAQHDVARLHSTVQAEPL